MKLIRIEPIRRCITSAAVTFGKRGLISFNKAFYTAAAVKAGMTCEFFRSDTDKRDWFVRFDNAEDGIKLRPCPGSGVAGNNVGITSQVLTTLAPGEKSISYRMSTKPDVVDGIEVYAIITRQKTINKY